MRLLMLKALSVRIERDGSCLCRSSAIVMVASSALLMVCLSGCDFISMCVVVLCLGSTTEAPSVGLLAIYDPFVYMKSVGVHAAWKCRMGAVYMWVGVGGFGE